MHDAFVGSFGHPACQQQRAVHILGRVGIGVCRELADLGFDEIVLTHCAYPTEGAVECLRPLGDKTGALEKLLRQLQGAVADWETEISLRACADADEPDSTSGQSEALLAIADAVISE